MTRDKFIELYWDYYMALDKDFADLERYIAFDLGDNYRYDGSTSDNPMNSTVYSTEFVKQYQAICSEIDVILEEICRELGYNKKDDMKMPDYAEWILRKWPEIKDQEVEFKKIKLKPFINWRAKTKDQDYSAPADWWPKYNKVKHKRSEFFNQANLKNTLNALAALYILEQYYVRYIGQKTKDKDVPNDISRIFEMVDFKTEENVIGKNTYTATRRDIEEIIQLGVDQANNEEESLEE